MISRGCTCLRRPLSAALDTIAAGPDEPLLFLYPRWAASAVRQRRPFSSLTSASASPKNRKNISLPPHAGVRPSASTSFAPTCRHASRWISHDAISTQLDGDSYVKLPDGHAEDEIKDKVEEKDTEYLLDSQPAIQSVSALEDRTASTTKLSGICARATKKSKYPIPEESEVWPLTPGSRNRVPMGLWERTLSPRNRKQVRYGEFTLERQKSEGRTPTHPKSWMDLRDMLLEVQSQSKSTTRRGTKYKELFIPEEAIALMSGATTPGKAMEENIWHLPVRHGCLVHVLPPEKGNGLCRKVVLMGSEGTLELVEESIKRQQELQASGDPLVEVQKSPVPIVASIQKLRQLNRPVPLVRGTWTSPLDDQERVYLDRLLESGPPSVASVKEFADHVEEVVNSQPLNHVKAGREGEHSRHSYPARVATHLSRLFSRDSNRKFCSTAALNSALRYLYKNEGVSVARTVFSEAEHLATVDSYNILLQSAALRQNKPMFEFFLKAMAQRRIRPNAGTWLALLQGMLTQKTKAAIIKDMAKKGYMKDINAIRSALQLTISDSFFVHLESGRDVHSFFDLMIKTHGADWFTASLLSQMFDVTSRLKNRVAMQELLDICIEYRLNMNSACLMQILDLAQNDIFTALEYTSQIMKRVSFKLEGNVLEKLFFFAYKGCHYNICRVLWHYACMEDTTTKHMRAVILDSLTRNVSLNSSSDDVRKIWHICAGKVIIRRSARAKFRISQEHLDQLPPEFHHNPFLYLVSGFKASGPERALQLKLAKAYMHRDILTGASPKYPLLVMLEAAATMDQEWAGKPWPLAWMLQNSIGISATRQSQVLE
ncbi:hypothetical protein PEBR_09339 [Penicillium brasilianum]|uniref:Pentatricopeptide repeat protein n=1 Tax=Penicillium brasilianum TaxID=104259 RepID=A0A1S9S1T0_PENBI|nr:hypothetical protein PEBR_09339 [Penicillium brasilianum]